MTEYTEPMLEEIQESDDPNHTIKTKEHKHYADKYTLFATGIRFLLGFLFSSFWIATLIDLVTHSPGDILGFSIPAAITGATIALFFAFSDAYCHLQQDRLSEKSANVKISEEEKKGTKLSFISKIPLRFAALADITSISGFFIALVLDIFKKFNQPIADIQIAILLISTFLIGLAACVAEYRSNKKALETASGITEPSNEPSEKPSQSSKDIKMDKWTSITAIVYFLLTWIGTGLWVASLWDSIAQNSEGVLSASLPAMIVGFGLSTILTVCYVRHRVIFNRLNQGPEGTSSKEPSQDAYNNWRWTSKNGLSILGAGAVLTMGLASLILEKTLYIFQEIAGSVVPQSYKIGFTALTFVISAFASVAESRTLRKALLLEEDQKRSLLSEAHPIEAVSLPSERRAPPSSSKSSLADAVCWAAGCCVGFWGSSAGVASIGMEEARTPTYSPAPRLNKMSDE